MVGALVVGTAEVAGVLMLAALEDEEVAGADSRELLLLLLLLLRDGELDSVTAGVSAEAAFVVGIGVRANEWVMDAAAVMAVVELLWDPAAGGRTMTQRASAPARSSAPRTEDETRIVGGRRRKTEETEISWTPARWVGARGRAV